jgi:hypothetical protein
VPRPPERPSFPAAGGEQIASRIAALSAREIADAAGASGPIARALVSLAARVPSARLGRTLARFDERTAEVGLSRAARETLARLGAAVSASGDRPRGAALVVVNHPGAYDALSIMAALDRDDVALVAAERAFLRALPNVSRHLAFVDEEDPHARASGVRRALAVLRRGGVVVQFGAGAIEPDVAFDPAPPALAPWRAGTGLFAARASRMGAEVVPAFVRGVHSARAKRLPFVRWAERRGTTTIAPLVQATMPGFDDVAVTIRFGAPIDRGPLSGAADDAARTEIIRAAVLALAPPRAPTGTT